MHRGREGHTGAVLRCPLRSQPRSAWDFGPGGVFVTHTFVPVFIELQCSQLTVAIVIKKNPRKTNMPCGLA